MAVHVGLLLVSAGWLLPIYPDASLEALRHRQIRRWGFWACWRSTVGLPYFLLSTTGPLLQAWYARRFKGAMPYRLYALSNAGSMFALLSYPVLFEPVFTTHQQAGMWSVAYGVFVVLCGVTAVRMGRTAGVGASRTKREAPGNGKPGAREYTLWLALPACASVLLLAITNHLSQNVAAIPFLWVLPLSIYLLSFILCFEGSGWYRYRRYPYLPLMAVALGGMAVAVDGLEQAPIALVAAFSCWDCLPAAWCATASWPCSNRIPGT